jgi:sporulation protein YlmC with PRC-barrel domain
MQLSHRQLLHLPVETKSGARLGVVASFEIDSEQQVVTRYTVRTAPLPKFLADELIIAPSQVVSITNEKMVVEDGVMPVAATDATPAL